MHKRSPIPGNKFSEMHRIYEDTTVEALEQHLRRIVANQNPTKRSNPRYVREVRRIKKAIAARTEG